MQFRQTVIYDRRQIAYRPQARREGKTFNYTVEQHPARHRKIPDKDRTCRVGQIIELGPGQMHPIVNKTVNVPIDLGMWYHGAGGINPTDAKRMSYPSNG